MIDANGGYRRLDLVGDELEPKLLDVMDDDEGELVVLRREGLLGAEKSIELQVVAIGAPAGQIDVHPGLDAAFRSLVVASHSTTSGARGFFHL